MENKLNANWGYVWAYRALITVDMITHMTVLDSLYKFVMVLANSLQNRLTTAI